MYVVMTKRTFNLNLRVAPDLDATFASNASKIGQTKSNLVVMLMESFNDAMTRGGGVIMPLQIKTPADCVPITAQVHNGNGYQVAHAAESKPSWKISKKGKQ